MIQITQTAVVAQPGAFQDLRAQFDETGCASLPGLLSPAILKHVLKLIETGRFEVTNETHKGRIFGTTFKMPSTEPTVTTLHFILNRLALFEMVERVVGCPRLGNFTCRIHRTVADTHQHIDWHDDWIQDRTVGLNINLSQQDYRGGQFQIRDPEGRVRSEIGRIAAGDAFLFRIGSGWQHRLTPVGSGERTVAVGWFRTQPDWNTLAIAQLRAKTLTIDLVGG